MNKNLKNHHYSVTKEDRLRRHGHQSFLILFTGLSGAGKSSIASRLEHLLFKKNIETYTLDGDNIRNGINKNLSFSPIDRSENNRRIAEISKLFIDAGTVVLAAIIAPYKKDRAIIKNIVAPENYIEVFVNTSLGTCEKRDPKGLYKKARAGEIKNMTGISDPYEAPTNPDIEINEHLSIDEATALVFEFIKDKLTVN
ncbi:adenylyl-sulfate kinase [Flavivirga spongiicola]|uniref:Adenylyl-sulfate kinase n=1 Tax=Flavivirga spongiicola TaxID=421621 RepID=A0ABU7XSE9_9FLAO|nr:adenylyl-sulfate kinase [Flavivirga sp. MEBiC05379]MDO5977864.1 adenylyl-sulfate kinase [Flavivirga sp. MEBiC05379]